jgi:para-aminobenzoate synthetase/4-amino-4-deoxychorismate lyase
MVKAKFLTGSAVEFALLESILWDTGYVDLERHLDRLGRSAEYFGFLYSSVRTHEALTLESARLAPGQPYKVRLTLDRMGALTCRSEGIERNAGQAMGTIALCEQRTDSRDRFLYHKTTNRALYDQAILQAREQGFAEVIFLNEKGEVTEGARSNVFVRRNGRLLTPPIRCGLLNGTYRQRVLEERTDACEQVLYAEDLQEADEVFICNSIRGWQPVMFNGATTLGANVPLPKTGATMERIYQGERGDA